MPAPVENRQSLPPLSMVRRHSDREVISPVDYLGQEGVKELTNHRLRVEGGKPTFLEIVAYIELHDHHNKEKADILLHRNAQDLKLVYGTKRRPLTDAEVKHYLEERKRSIELESKPLKSRFKK